MKDRAKAMLSTRNMSWKCHLFAFTRLPDPFHVTWPMSSKISRTSNSVRACDPNLRTENVSQNVLFIRSALFSGNIWIELHSMTLSTALVTTNSFDELRANKRSFGYFAECETGQPDPTSSKEMGRSQWHAFLTHLHHIHRHPFNPKERPQQCAVNSL